MNRPIRWYDYITFNVYYLGITSLSQTMTPLVVPLLIQQFVGDELKGTYYGTLRLWSLMVALLVQALMGMLSDHSTSRWGRRRPFIFIGTLLDLVVMALIGVSAAMDGLSGYWFLFAMALMLQVTTNMAHGAQQGLIPDLVPDDKRGKFSGIKAIFEVPIPLILISFTVAKLISRGQMWAGIILAMIILIITMILTMFVPENRLESAPSHLDWKPFSRLILMTLFFTLIILAMGKLVNLAGVMFSSITSPTLLAFSMGSIGLIAMGTAIVAGVWMSIRIGIGKEISRTPSFTWWVINRLAFLVGATNLASFTIYFLQARLGYIREKAAGPAALLTMFVGVFILFSALPSGWLADRFGHKRLVIASGIIAAAGTLIAIVVPSLPIIYAGGCIIGAGIGLFYTANWALGTEIVPKNQAGRFLGLSNLAGAGAGAVGAYIGGPIADYMTRAVPDFPGLGYLILFAIYGTLFLFSILPIMRVTEKTQMHLVRGS